MILNFLIFLYKTRHAQVKMPLRMIAVTAFLVLLLIVLAVGMYYKFGKPLNSEETTASLSVIESGGVLS